MFKHVTTAARSVARRAEAGFMTVKAMAVTLAVALLGLFVAGPAAAQNGPAAAISAELSSLAGDLGGIIALLAAGLAVIIVWAYVKRGSR